MHTFHAEHLWRPDGWARDVELAGAGRGRFVLPGVVDAHSHAFQRAMAGMAERQTAAQDSFWTWRETMYRFAARLDPDSLQAVAAQLYAELLEAGYTRVCEFHYLHHAPDGRPYADPAAMSRALVAAARETGIGLTLLPTLYMQGGFDGRPLDARQMRFAHSVDAYLRLVGMLQAEALDDARVRVGVAFHSLRAVPPEALRAMLDAVAPELPVHIHVAEQTAEVADCVAARGARPVAWLLDNAPVDARWTLVHATHLEPTEVQGIARSGATVALCPTTEANLGDGLFPLRDFLDAGGVFSIGTDSHVSTSLAEELKMLEYGQRLAHRRRNVAAAGGGSTGEALFAAALAGGRRSGGCDAAADGVVVLDAEAPRFAGAGTADVLDRWVFAGHGEAIDEVWVGGERLVAQGRHRERTAIAARYRAAIARLLAE